VALRRVGDEQDVRLRLRLRRRHVVSSLLRAQGSAVDWAAWIWVLGGEEEGIRLSAQLVSLKKCIS
jgi:hypothetical protein